MGAGIVMILHPFLKNPRNMYSASEIKTNLLSLVGFRQNTDQTGWQLTSLTTSDSHLYFDGLHPLITIENLSSICPEFDRIHAGDATARNQAFTAWLQTKVEDGILQAIDRWIGEKMEFQTAKAVLEDKRLFNPDGNSFALDSLTSGTFSGIELTPSKSKSLRVHIRKIAIQFEQNQSINILVYQSGKSAPLFTETVNYTGTGDWQEVEVDWLLPSGYRYWIGYDNDAVTGQYVNAVTDYDWQGYEYPSGRHYQAKAFSIDGYAGSLWDLGNTQHSVSTNYGLNLSLDVRCDYTDLVLEQRRLFASAIGYQVAINLLRELALNPNSRINRHESNVDIIQVMHEIEGDSRGRNKHSLAGKLETALKSIAFDTGSIDSVCLPCRKRGIAYKALGPR